MNFSNFREISTYKDIKNFFQKNKKVLKYLDEYEGIDNLMGSGESGKVWKISNKELTLKITDDPQEIEIANKLVGKNLKTFLKIYVAVEVGELQLRIQELCYPLDDELKGVFPGKIHYFLTDNKFYSPEIAFDEYVEEFPVNPRDKVKVKKVIEFMMDVLEDAAKAGLSEQEVYEMDIHSGNVMKTKDGKLKLVDF